MLNFVKRAFRSFLGVLLWINLVVSVISGGVAGYNGGKLGYMVAGFISLDLPYSVWRIVGAIVGLIIGAILGLLTNILFGGLVVTLLEIGSDITDIKADVANIKGFAADTRTSTAETAAVFQKMANRGAPGGNMQ